MEKKEVPHGVSCYFSLLVPLRAGKRPVAKLNKRLKKVLPKKTEFYRLNLSIIGVIRFKNTPSEFEIENIEGQINEVYEEYIQSFLEVQREAHNKDYALMFKVLKKFGTTEKEELEEIAEFNIQKSLGTLEGILQGTKLFYWIEKESERSFPLSLHLGDSHLEVESFGINSDGKENYEHLENLTDELAFLCILKPTVEMLKAGQLLLHVTNSLDTFVEHFSGLIENGYVSKKRKDQMAELLSILVGQYLSIRDFLWTLYQFVLKAKDFEMKLRQEAEKFGLFGEHLIQTYLGIVDGENADEVAKYLKDVIEFITEKSQDLRALTIQADLKEANNPAGIDKIEDSSIILFSLNLFCNLDFIETLSIHLVDFISYSTVEDNIAYESGEQKLPKKIETDSILETVDVYRTFTIDNNNIYALRNVNLKIPEGDFLAIVGPSGSGKSTLLNVLSSLDKPSRGGIYLEGENLADIRHGRIQKIRRERISFVFQDFVLVPEFNNVQNVKLPAVVSSNSRGGEAVPLLESMGVGSEFSNRLPGTMSGGQQQRIAVARALINEPKILFADEPTGSLDKETKEPLMNLFLELNKAGSTIVLITHDLEVASYAKRVAIMVNGEIQRIVSTEEEDIREAFQKYVLI